MRLFKDLEKARFTLTNLLTLCIDVLSNLSKSQSKELFTQLQQESAERQLAFVQDMKNNLEVKTNTLLKELKQGENEAFSQKR